jgi:hypothetical protein
MGVGRRSGNLTSVGDLAVADGPDGSRFKSYDGDRFAAKSGKFHLIGWATILCRIVEYNSTNIPRHKAVFRHVSRQGNHIEFFDHSRPLNQAQR